MTRRNTVLECADSEQNFFFSRLVETISVLRRSRSGDQRGRNEQDMYSLSLVSPRQLSGWRKWIRPIDRLEAVLRSGSVCCLHSYSRAVPERKQMYVVLLMTLTKWSCVRHWPDHTRSLSSQHALSCSANSLLSSIAKVFKIPPDNVPTEFHPANILASSSLHFRSDITSPTRLSESTDYFRPSHMSRGASLSVSVKVTGGTCTTRAGTATPPPFVMMVLVSLTSSFASLSHPKYIIISCAFHNSGWACSHLSLYIRINFRFKNMRRPFGTCV